MGFQTKTVTRAELAPDLPKAHEAAQQHSDGAVYESESTDPKYRGKKYRLRHARWIPVVVRKRDASSNGAKAKK